MYDKVYVEDFDKGPGGWEEWPNPLVVKDSYAMTSSPWWVDFNHAPPGGGYLHLLYCLYTTSEDAKNREAVAGKNRFAAGNFPCNWINASITVRIKGDMKMRDTELVLLVQSSVGSHRQNHVLSGQPIKVTKDWTEQTLTLVPDQSQWTSLGSRHDRMDFYGHGNIEDVLKDLNGDIIFVLHPLKIVPKQKIKNDIHMLRAGRDYDVDENYLPEGYVMLDKISIEFS
tara:strand:+ start:10987 stop:11667 length:681 start_codon:yes stop_codon:yes gene_type:complete